MKNGCNHMSEMEWLYVQCQYLALPCSDFSMSKFLYVGVIYNASNESINTNVFERKYFQ